MQALDVVGETTGNEVINVAMKDVQTAVRDGQPMSSPLRHHKIFPAMVTQMVEVGEESGQISQMLDKVADFYDREVDDRRRVADRLDRTDHGARHGRRGRRHGDLPVPADVHDLPEHPERTDAPGLPTGADRPPRGRSAPVTCAFGAPPNPSKFLRRSSSVRT